MVGILDVGNEQGSRAVLLREIHSHTEIHVWTLQSGSAAVAGKITVVELRKRVERAQDGPRDQVGVRRFAAIVFREMFVDEVAILFEQFYRNSSFGSRG